MGFSQRVFQGPGVVTLALVSLQNPDQTYVVGRPAEKDYLEQHVRAKKPRLGDRLSGCFCGGKGAGRGGRQQEQQALEAEQWHRLQPQLVQ